MYILSYHLIYNNIQFYFNFAPCYLRACCCARLSICIILYMYDDDTLHFTHTNTNTRIYIYCNLIRYDMHVVVDNFCTWNEQHVNQVEYMKFVCRRRRNILAEYRHTYIYVKSSVRVIYVYASGVYRCARSYTVYIEIYTHLYTTIYTTIHTSSYIVQI